MAQKVDPYLRPLTDALMTCSARKGPRNSLNEVSSRLPRWPSCGVRTLNNAFIILDEAQNTTREQMKMFLTRIGFDSRAVVTGDITQIDLPGRSHSGLVEANEILRSVSAESSSVIFPNPTLSATLVQEIIQGLRAAGRWNRKKKPSALDRNVHSGNQLICTSPRKSACPASH